MISHLGFIIASYSITAAVLLGLIVWVLADGKAQKTALTELDKRGVRRSAAPR
jgi:heme exporter protein D